jgi:predicted DNA-binding transcriptional regulator AlpA
MHTSVTTQHIGFYTQKQFLELVPVSVATLYNGIGSGRFPRPIKIGNGRANFFRKDQTHALIETGEWRLTSDFSGDAE